MLQNARFMTKTQRCFNIHGAHYDWHFISKSYPLYLAEDRKVTFVGSCTKVQSVGRMSSQKIEKETCSRHFYCCIGNCLHNICPILWRYLLVRVMWVNIYTTFAQYVFYLDIYIYYPGAIHTSVRIYPSMSRDRVNLYTFCVIG